MSDQLFLAAVIGPTFLVLGLSVLFYADVWNKLVGEWEKNHFSLLATMFFSLIFGLVVINKYNTWDWSPYVIVTISGWAAIIKAVVYFLVPGKHYKAMIKMLNCKCYFQASGAIMTLLGAWLSYLVYVA